MTRQDPQAFDESEPLSPYEAYEARFDPERTNRQAHRSRRGPRPSMRRSQREAVSELADPDVLEAGFETTYSPSRFEAGWLYSAMHGFYEDGLITDILALIKGGKEASVYRCQAHPATGLEFVAAKVYRPRMFRNLRNDKLYRQGREILTDGGRVVRKSDQRTMKAIERKTRFGLEVRHTSWLMYEFVTLRALYDAGGAVPRPIAAGGNAILMEYLGDERRAAPTLHEIELDMTQAQALFAEVRRNIELMLSQAIVHGDLSAYNILYWDADPAATARNRIALIDFPQVVNVYVNRQARQILARDILRICEYFQRQGVVCDPDAILADLWGRYGVEQPLPDELLISEEETI